MSENKKSSIERIFDQIETRGLDSLTASERWYLGLYWLGAETQSGGFHQYFFNDGSRFAPDALRGLEAVGADEAAKILRRAMEIFPKGVYPADTEERRRVLVALPSRIQEGRLDKLTRQFWDATKDFADRVQAYIVSHPDEFPIFRQ